MMTLTHKLLLTSVFGPHAVDDRYEKKTNLMELFHNQVTCEQSVSFLRKLFGEDAGKPIRHPLLHSAHNRRVTGVPLPESSGILIAVKRTGDNLKGGRVCQKETERGPRARGR